MVGFVSFCDQSSRVWVTIQVELYSRDHAGKVLPSREILGAGKVLCWGLCWR